ncbi:unnamed protein product [Rhizophagus irregularis]|nr:unnamed protein product [Rhizophagus irregularis]
MTKVTKIRIVLKRKCLLVRDKVSDVEINYQQEKEKINDEKESTDVNYKKKSNNKHKSGNDGESNNNWQVYEVDILLQYIADNFDEYTKDHNEKFGVERKYWDCYEKMDAIFGTHENIAPSFIANRSTDIDDTIAMAISTMSETKERVWEKKLKLEKERIEKNYTIEMGKLEVGKQRWEFEREKMKMEHELKLKEMKLRQSNNMS